MNKSHSIFCDIDGTILHHFGNLSTQITNEQCILLSNIREAFNLWDKKGYKIILTTLATYLFFIFWLSFGSATA